MSTIAVRAGGGVLTKGIQGNAFALRAGFGDSLVEFWAVGLAIGLINSVPELEGCDEFMGGDGSSSMETGIKNIEPCVGPRELEGGCTSGMKASGFNGVVGQLLFPDGELPLVNGVREFLLGESGTRKNLILILNKRIIAINMGTEEGILCGTGVNRLDKVSGEGMAS